MNKKTAIVAAVVVVALVAAIVLLMNANSQAQRDAYDKAGLSSGQQETIDRINRTAEELQSEREKAETAMKEVEETLSKAGGMMVDYNDSVDAGSPDASIIDEIADVLEISRDEVSDMLGEDGKFGKKADDALIVMKGQRLLEADEDAYEKAKELAGSGE